MAWYDYFFDCKILPLRKGEMSLQKYIKPESHEPEKQKEWIKDYDQKIV